MQHRHTKFIALSVLAAVLMLGLAARVALAATYSSFNDCVDIVLALNAVFFLDLFVSRSLFSDDVDKQMMTGLVSASAIVMHMTYLLRQRKKGDIAIRFEKNKN